MQNMSYSDCTMKVLLIGNSGSGKSCVITRYTEQKFIANFYNTIGVDFKIKIVEQDGLKVKLQIWDTAGQDRFKNITSSYYRGAHGIIIVYDITNQNSFESVKSWIKQIQQYADEQISMILVGNKSDLEERRQVSYEKANEFAKSLKIKFIQTSARDGTNVSEAFSELVDIILAKTKIKNLPQDGQKLKKKKEKIEKQSCC